eukprot:scaffold63241_cov53-Phaeocystis_antarctica.AAC.1
MLLSLLATIVAADNSHRSRKDKKARHVPGYMLVYHKGYCGGLGETLSRRVRDPQECFKLALDHFATGFSMGRRYRKGKCSVELLEFTSDDYNQWLVRAPLSPPTRACPLTDPDTRVARRPQHRLRLCQSALSLFSLSF